MSKTPAFIPHLFPSMMWKGPKGEHNPCVYLTFDDGPVKKITPWVLDVLKEYNSQSTFFCLGKNVEANPGLYQKIIQNGHSVGNHTYSHVSGYKSKMKSYLSEIEKASEWINSNLFRPPYGKIKWSQIKAVKSQYTIVMWDIMSGDFDPHTSADKCVNNVLKHVTDGSIIVFHDNDKAFPNLRKSLPKILSSLSSEGYQFLPLKVRS